MEKHVPDSKARAFEIMDEELLHESFYKVMRYRLRFQRFDGSWSNPMSREVTIRHKVAAALPYDPILDKVILIEQFRIGALTHEPDPWLLELVAGIQDREDEALETLARRETQEEAGLEVLELIPICQYWSSPGGSTEHVSLYCARVDASNAGGIHGAPSEEEDIRVHVMDANEAFEALHNGRIVNATTIIALQWLALHHRDFRKSSTG